MENGVKTASKKLIAVFILPGITLFCFAMLIPIFLALYYSFFDWESISKPVANGFANYARLVSDRLFWSSLFNNLKLAIYTLVGQVGIGYLMAIILKVKFIRLGRLHRTVMFFPVVIGTVVLSFLWMLVYSNDFGIINNFLKMVGLGQFATVWLSDPRVVIEALAVPLIWQWFGFYMVIFMGAIEAIPEEVLESAEIDGANGFKRIVYIFIPLTYNTLKVAVVLCLAGIMKMFDHILVMTAGGPGDSSMVLALYAYKTSFTDFQLGYGNTISVGILLISLTITLLARKLMGGKRYE